VHATIAGVLLAFTVPATTRIDGGSFVRRARELVDSFAAADHPEDVRRSDERQSALAELEDATEAIQTPLQRLEHNLHPWVAYVIVPLFALANAGVVLSDDTIGEALTSSVSAGVVLGLVLGKTVGITTFSLLAVRLRVARLPTGVSWPEIVAMSALAGIGFTVSLFVAGLAFPESPAIEEQAKVAILAASLVAALLGAGLLLAAGKRDRRADREG
jgi:NhaA family Na+:H+ antiporter